MKKFTSLILAVLITFPLTVSAAPIFSDNVTNFLSELSIMQGDPNGNMRYDDLVSRAECTKIVVNTSAYKDTVALGSKTSPFKDVPYTHWASPYITVGIKNGLLKGYLDATFRPSNTVLYEEAATMFLRILGYTDEDFGSSWPNGQVGIAKNIGVLDNIDKGIGDELTRRDMAAMAYNTLNATKKGSQSAYIGTFNRTIVDDVVLISTMNEDSSIQEGKIFTSAGTYNVSDTLDTSNIGKRGSMVLRNNDTVVSFIPNSLSKDNDEQMVYSALGDGIVTYKNGSFNQIDINADTVFYKDSQKVNAASALATLEMGDILRVSYKSNGEVDYIMCTKGSTIGPKTVNSSDWYSSFGADSSLTVMRDGVKSSVSEVKTNDIAYYLKELNIALVYSKKVTGIYESATPNKDAPTSVTVSGVTYNLEGVNAFSKLSSSGMFNYGDTVTLLLGRSGEVADVLTSSNVSNKVYGFLSSVGTKETTVSGSTATKPYAKVVLPSGEVCEYITDKNYSSLLNSVVTVKLDGGTASLTRYNSNNNIYGKFVWSAPYHALGDNLVSEDVKIIETTSVSSLETALVGSVYPQRLNGITISSGNILYTSKNSKGEIDAIILNDLTGDLYTYGIMTKVKNNSMGNSLSGSYEYITNGVYTTLSTQNKTFSTSLNQAVKIKTDGRTAISLTPLTKLSGSKITDINGATLSIGSNSYTMSDKVQIYLKKSLTSTDYSMLTTDELLDMIDDYSAAVYTDKAHSAGGRIRIIVLTGNY